MVIKKIFRDIRMLTNKLSNAISYKDNGYIIFGEWMGKQATDNCVYLANYICMNYPDVKVAWVCNKNADLSLLNEKIERLDRSTKDTESIVKNASALIMNQGIIDFSDSDSFNVSKPLTVNIWHGIPWKKIGYDGIHKTGKFKSIEHKYQIKIKASDLYISPSEEYKEKFSKAFFVKESKFINAGYPRNTLFYNNVEIQKSKMKIIDRIPDKDAKLIVYLPTFRDSKSQPFSFSDISNKDFKEWLKKNNVYIIQKAHTVEQGVLGSDNSNIFNFSDISAQELMAASDMLITDYSSCFYDYIILDRPIIHFLYDYEFYKNLDRGLYYDKQDVVCGSAPETVPDLIDAIYKNFENPNLYHELRMKRKEKFLTYESPNSCEIISKRIFKEIEKRG